MRRVLLLGALAALATCTPARAIVSTYNDVLYGRVAGIAVVARVEIEIDGTPAIGATNRARARLLSDPGPWAVSKSWSRWHKAVIGGQPAVFAIASTGLKGSLSVDWTLSNITVSASGSAAGIPVEITPQTLTMTSQAVGRVETAPVTPAVPAPVSGPVLLSARSDGKYVHFQVAGIDGWPKKEVGGKTCCALLYVNGRKVEWIPCGRNYTGLKNLWEDPDYRQPVKPGDMIRVSIVSTDGKRKTNELTIRM